jgi:hypothetical protein
MLFRIIEPHECIRDDIYLFQCKICFKWMGIPSDNPKKLNEVMKDGK